MKPVGIHHAAVLVTDVARATRFYTEVLGFTRIRRPDLGFGGAWLACSPHELHLIRSEAVEPVSRRHIACAIDDAGALAKGPGRGRVHGTGGCGEIRRFFLRDPDHNQIELTTERSRESR